MKPRKQKSAALYARYSSDMQKDRSIDDQFALCATYAGREGFKVISQFADRAKSSATLFDRDNLLELMQAAKARKFEAIIVENLDRLSRDQEDLAGLFKKLKFYGVELRTVNEGETTDTHIGLRGMFGAMFLKDLKDKVRRHHIGRVKEGHVMGAVSYGYQSIPGKPGERVIHPERAAVVRRIFTEYAKGVSPADIANGLTRDNIPSPAGAREWSHQSFIGGGGKTGLLGNRLYIGELTWNKHHYDRNPETNSVVARVNPEDQHLVVSVPHLRIVDQPLWDAAQAVRRGRSVAKFGPNGMTTRAVIPRGDHLLSGLLRCGQCNGDMIVVSKSRGEQFVSCAAARTKATCEHRKSYSIDGLKKLVLDNFRDNMVDPKRHAEALRAAHTEYAALAKKNSGEKGAAEKQRNRLVVQIARLVSAISDSDEPLPALLDSLKKKEAERVGLEERIRLLGADNVVHLHPKVIDTYKETIEKLHKKLSTNSDDIETKTAFRNIMDSIVVHPTGYREPYVVDAYGRLSAIMGIDLFPIKRSAKKILAAEGVICSDNNALDLARLQLSQQRDNVISLGRWRAAA